MSSCYSVCITSKINDFSFQKVRAHLRVLHQSTGLDDDAKKRIAPVLLAKYMSSEESLVEDSSDDDGNNNHASGSDTENAAHGKKKLLRHKLPWRSREFEIVIESLDRKLDRRRDPKSKAMCLDVQGGENSSREKPDDMPEWAVNLHH